MRAIIAVVISVVLFVLLRYFFLPNMDPVHFMAMPGVILLIAIIIFALYVTSESTEGLRVKNSSIGIGVVCLLYMFVAGCGSNTFFNTTEYQTLLGKVDDKGVFSSDLAPVSTEQIRIVDEEVAKRVGEKILGEKVALGSQVELGTFHIQQVQGRLYWVACLEHSNFFRWASNSGTPGYVMVSATNESDVRLVTEVDGKPMNIVYQTAAYFGQDVSRRIYMTGYSAKGYTDITFEIDDDMRPYWVATLYNPTIWAGGNDAYGVVVVDAQTGEVKEYNRDETPLWIDRMEPEEFITNQIGWWGDLVNGWWNPSGLNKLKVTSVDGHSASLVYGEDSRCYWYVGLSSTGSDNGTVGFMLVDSRDKTVKFYHQSGATEEAAMGSAQGQVQEKGYHANFPITYNIGGVPTYYMSLKDQAGLVKMMAFVSITDFNTVGVGDNLNSALRKYHAALSSQGNAVHASSRIKRQSVSGKVSRFAINVSDGNSSYYITLEKMPELIFVGNINTSTELPITSPGDEVTIEFDNTGNTPIDLSNFDNLAFSPQATQASLDRSEYFNEVRKGDVIFDDIQNAEHRFEDLPDSVKVKLMKEQQPSSN